MVSLEKKIDYLSRINESQKLAAFNNFLLGKSITLLQKETLSESEEIYFGIVSTIHLNDKKTFEKYYSKKNKSNPSKESPPPFVNDDFLIFSLIVGVAKFNIDKSWIQSIVSIRNRNANTITFENILNENYYSTSNLPEIVLMFLQLNNQSLITNDFVNFALKRINENTSLFESRSDFQILCAIKAYDLSIELKEAPAGSEIYLLKRFNKRFVRRVKILSWLIQVVILSALIYILLHLPKYSPETVILIDKYNYAFTILGALGFTFLGNQFSFIKNKSNELIMKLLGYPKGLIERNKNET